jgi:hypothetical protein
MRRALLTAVILVMAIAGPASADPTTVATDPCGNGPSLDEGLALAGQDICAISVDTLAAGEDVATTLQVTMQLAGDPTELPSAHSVAWGAGGCGFVPYRTDRGGLEVRTGIAVFCG